MTKCTHIFEFEESKNKPKKKCLKNVLAKLSGIEQIEIISVILSNLEQEQFGLI